MRVVFVIPGKNLSGGIRIVAEHARMLHERGHEVCVVARQGRPVTVWRRIRQMLRGQGWKVAVEGATHLDDVPYRVHTVDSSRPIVGDDVPDADLILATWWATAEWVAAMPACKGVKVNFLQHYEAHPGQPKDRVDAVWRLPMRKIVVSRWLEGIAREQFGDDSAILVPNGVNTSDFPFVDRGLSGRRVVGAMFSPASFKRFDLACEVVRELARRGRAVEFVGFGARSAGDGVLPEGARFEVSPTQRRIAEVYASCDCWLFTSDKEGYGLPLLEAMSSGTPVVATAAGAAPELLCSGGGRLVDSDDPGVLADAVEEILSLEDAQWRAMSRAARDEAQRHSWDEIGDAMELALKRILEESDREAGEV